ncbi:MAG: tripartite tricarboxylate transporter TctB family protein [Betaproteobacteria bacterium]|nr:tripartite tricarboxylate transporter TctB family protein [Betaproteobacteria bacterium]
MNKPAGRDVRGIVGSVLAIAGGALAFYHAKEFTPLGSVFPRTIAAAMMIFAAVYIATALLRPGEQPPQPTGSTWRRVALVVVLALWSVFLEKLGFLTSSVAAYAAILVIANYDQWTPRRALGYALAGAAVLGGLYSIFRFVLQVPLPEGIFL